MEYSAPSADTSQNKEELLKSRLRHDIGATVAACLAITCGALMAFYKTGNVFSVAMVAHVILAYTFAMIMDSGNQVAGKIRILERGDASEASESPDPGHVAHQGF